MSKWCLPAQCLALVLGVLPLLPGGALACSLDGIASLSVDGRQASPNGGATGMGPAVWASFTLDAAKPGAVLHFAEDLARLRRTLPARAFDAPLRWTFGDGATANGRAVAHRYARAGQYTITVSYYWQLRHRWIGFDRAAEAILPSGALWRPAHAPAAMGAQIMLLGLTPALAAGGLLFRARIRRWYRGLRPAPRPHRVPARTRPRRPTLP
jgi:PKD domain-containing protein